MNQVKIERQYSQGVIDQFGDHDPLVEAMADRGLEVARESANAKARSATDQELDELLAQRPTTVRDFSRKQAESRANKKEMVKWDLSEYRSPLHVPRPSICSKRIRLCTEHTGCVTTENVHCHSLDRTDVDKRVARLWIGQVVLWKNRRVKLFIFAKIRLLKALLREDRGGMPPRNPRRCPIVSISTHLTRFPQHTISAFAHSS